MKYQVVIRPHADDDIRKAYQWYEERADGLGSEFLRAVVAATERLERSPLTFKIERGKYRRLHLRKFPYALHFEIAASEVSVLACLHFRQDPTRWPGG